MDPVASLIARFARVERYAQRRRKPLDDRDWLGPPEPIRVSGPVRWERERDPYEEDDDVPMEPEEVPSEKRFQDPPPPRGQGWITITRSDAGRCSMCHRRLHPGDVGYRSGHGYVTCSSTCANTADAQHPRDDLYVSPDNGGEAGQYPAHPIGPFHRDSVRALLRRLEVAP